MGENATYYTSCSCLVKKLLPTGVNNFFAPTPQLRCSLSPPLRLSHNKMAPQSRISSSARTRPISVEHSIGAANRRPRHACCCLRYVTYLEMVTQFHKENFLFLSFHFIIHLIFALSVEQIALDIQFPTDRSLLFVIPLIYWHEELSDSLKLRSLPSIPVYIILFITHSFLILIYVFFLMIDFLNTIKHHCIFYYFLLFKMFVKMITITPHW